MIDVSEVLTAYIIRATIRRQPSSNGIILTSGKLLYAHISISSVLPIRPFVSLITIFLSDKESKVVPLLH
jgi:hypothetical protein